jgi:tellurite resistance protein TerC
MAIASAEAHLAGNQPLAEPQALFFTDRREWEAYVLKAAVVPLSLISFETTPANMELALSASRSDGSGLMGAGDGTLASAVRGLRSRFGKRLTLPEVLAEPVHSVDQSWRWTKKWPDLKTSSAKMPPRIDGQMHFVSERTGLPLSFVLTLVGQAHTDRDPQGLDAAQDFVRDMEAGLADLDFRNAVEVGARGHSNDDFDVQVQLPRGGDAASRSRAPCAEVYALGFDLLDNDNDSGRDAAEERLEVYVSSAAAERSGLDVSGTGKGQRLARTAQTLSDRAPGGKRGDEDDEVQQNSPDEEANSRVLLATLHDVPTGQSRFLGVVSTVPLHSVIFREDDGPDDVAVRDLAFGVHVAASTSLGWGWALFALVISTALFVDLRCTGGPTRGAKVAHDARSARRQLLMSAGWSVAWIALSLGFGVAVQKWYGRDRALLFLSAYILERSLSLDNVFVFLVIFRSFRTPAALQPIGLNWGIMLALVLRAFAIAAGTYLLELFSFVSCLLGVFLIWTGIKMAAEAPPSLDEGGEAAGEAAREAEAQRSTAERWLGLFVPLTKEYDPMGRLFVLKEPMAQNAPCRSSDSLTDGRGARLAEMRARIVELESIGSGSFGSPSAVTGGGLHTHAVGKEDCESSRKSWHATPLVLALAVIGVSDLVFAIDSIPAILSITTDPFIIITSNCFAVLGLRALFFLLAALEKTVVYLNIALSAILTMVGVKMCLGCIGVEVHATTMLAFMICSLSVAIGASVCAGDGAQKGMRRLPQDAIGSRLTV